MAIMAAALRCFALLTLTLALAACSPSRALEAKRLLEDIAAGDGPSTLKAETATPSRKVVRFGREGRQHLGDLYRPAEPALAAVVLVPGVTPHGKDDARLVALATSLARVRFAVLVPEIPNLRALQVRPGDAIPIVDALQALTGSGEILPAAETYKTAGVAAISYAVGPALLAVLEPNMQDRVGFLFLVGGYRDMTDLVTFFTTGFYRTGPEAPWVAGAPAPYAKWAFAKANANLLSEQRDQVLLTAMAERRRNDPAADLDDLAGRLGPEGKSVYALLTNRDPERIPALIAALPPAITDDLAGLDLSARDLSTLQRDVILIHGRDDPVIPFTESQALAEAIGPSRADLHLVDNLAHVDLGPGGLDDALALWQAAYDLLALRDRLATKK